MIRTCCGGSCGPSSHCEDSGNQGRWFLLTPLTTTTLLGLGPGFGPYFGLGISFPAFFCYLCLVSGVRGSFLPGILLLLVPAGKQLEIWGVLFHCSCSSVGTEYFNEVSQSGASPAGSSECGPSYPCVPGERALPSASLVYSPAPLTLAVTACYCSSCEGKQSGFLPEALALCVLLSTLCSVSVLLVVVMLLGGSAHFIK